MRFFGSTGCIDSEVPPKSSKYELHMLFQDPDMGCYLASASVQFHLQFPASFSKKGNGKEKKAF